MTTPVLVVGHRNPDNDSICSAVAYAHFKNACEQRRLDGPQYEYIPRRLGPLPPESEWLLNKNGFDIPRYLPHVHARVKDVMTPNPISIDCNATLMEAGRTLRHNNVRALVVTREDETYMGLITTRMIAERYIRATDMLEQGGGNQIAVVADLIDSLEQRVEEMTETDVLTLDREDLLNEAIEDLMASSLREAVVIDDDNRAVGIITRSDITKQPRRKVVLVDHNELSQAAIGMDEAEVLEVIDHHRIADVSSAKPITFINLPVGCTATIITMEYRRHGIEIPRDIAELLLGAIMTDTIILKSPTTTDTDREQVEYLSQLLGVDHVEFGLELFKARGGDEDVSIDRLVGADAKEFELGDHVVLIAQRETVDVSGILAREDEIREYMRELIEQKGYEFVLLLVTDIMAEGSVFLCEGNRRIVSRVFNIECSGQKGGTWMPGILSRKKQVAAKLLGA